ncbi:hypothetical protein [Pseudoxanthomonas winnipegensis]|uniref:hypothetical protein n=1 Tax=Pseudoxanthomonas winnipegensis TaxID=2480810 RepID=UPI0013EE769E|nr:hypothetical protein [Pseudoxanthomonas winnipegensis]
MTNPAPVSLGDIAKRVEALEAEREVLVAVVEALVHGLAPNNSALRDALTDALQSVQVKHPLGSAKKEAVMAAVARTGLVQKLGNL